MSNFKVGDIVELVQNYGSFKIGDKAKVIGVRDSYSTTENGLLEIENDSGNTAGIFGSRVKLLSGLSRGDVLEADDARYTKEVLHVLPDGIVVTQDSDDLEIHAYANEAELLGDGWKKETTAKEYTLKEIADKLNIDVTDLRIKE